MLTAAVVDLSKRVAEGEFEVPTASKGSIESPLMLRAREMRSSFLDNLGLGDSLEKKNIEIKEFKMSLRLKDRLLVEQTELREASVRHLDVLRVDLTKRLTLAEEGRDRALHRCLISEVPPPLCDSNSAPSQKSKETGQQAIIDALEKEIVGAETGVTMYMFARATTDTTYVNVVTHQKHRNLFNP